MLLPSRATIAVLQKLIHRSASALRRVKTGMVENHKLPRPQGPNRSLAPGLQEAQR